jgi:hypothetical protein
MSSVIVFRKQRRVVIDFEHIDERVRSTNPDYDPTQAE